MLEKIALLLLGFFIKPIWDRVLRSWDLRNKPFIEDKSTFKQLNEFIKSYHKALINRSFLVDGFEIKVKGYSFLDAYHEIEGLLFLDNGLNIKFEELEKSYCNIVVQLLNYYEEDINHDVGHTTYRMLNYKTDASFKTTESDNESNNEVEPKKNIDELIKDMHELEKDFIEFRKVAKKVIFNKKEE